MSYNHDVFFSDDGIFAVKANMCADAAERCSFCGYEVVQGERAMLLHSGELIHENCWIDYAEENSELFGKRFIYSQEW